MTKLMGGWQIQIQEESHTFVLKVEEANYGGWGQPPLWNKIWAIVKGWLYLGVTALLQYHGDEVRTKVISSGRCRQGSH